MKTCTRCTKQKPLPAFNKDATRRDGRQNWCRICERDYHQTFPAPIAAAIKRAAIAKDLAKGLKKCSRCSEKKNLEKFYPRRTGPGRTLMTWCADCMAAYGAEHREQARERNRRYRLKPEARYLAYLKGAENRNLSTAGFTFHKFSELIKLPCAYGSGTSNPELIMGVDRMDSSLGYNVVDNLVPCCTAHNMQKKTFSYRQMRAAMDAEPTPCSNYHPIMKLFNTMRRANIA